MEGDSALNRLGVVPATADSDQRFADGAHFRIEIPSVEGPRVMDAVVEAAATEGVIINRISQGSGAMLLSTAELEEMAAIGAANGMEVSLFVGPREGFDIGGHARSPDGSAHAGQVRGVRGLRFAAEDVVRAVEAGIRSFLVADHGLLTVLVEMQNAGELPREVVWKVSVLTAPSNPASFALLERLGATTVNIPSDVTLEQIREFRAAGSLPLDLYVESPDGLGGVVRGNELGDLVAAGAPLYAKFGLRNSRALYPSGVHVANDAAAIAREKVHRAAVALEWLERLRPELVQSQEPAPDLGVPVVGSRAGT